MVALSMLLLVLVASEDCGSSSSSRNSCGESRHGRLEEAVSLLQHTRLPAGTSQENTALDVLRVGQRPDEVETPSCEFGPVQNNNDSDLAEVRQIVEMACGTASATFSFVGAFNEKTARLFRNLPARLPAKPYLVWGHTLECPTPADCPEAERLIKERTDFVFANWDLRDPWLVDDSHKPSPGVTMGPPSRFKGGIVRIDPTETPRYLATFRGSMRSGWFDSASVRPDLEHLWSGVQVNGSVVEFLHPPLNGTYNIERYADLLNTTYALVPHGDHRWSFRFTEVVNAGAIPVVIADGLTLPYAQLIDWSKAAIILPESLVKNLSHPQGLIDLLPKDPQTVQAMRQAVCDISLKYFETPSKRWEATLKSAAVYVAERSVA